MESWRPLWWKILTLGKVIFNLTGWLADFTVSRREAIDSRTIDAQSIDERGTRRTLICCVL